MPQAVLMRIGRDSEICLIQMSFSAMIDSVKRLRSDSKTEIRRDTGNEIKEYFGSCSGY